MNTLCISPSQYRSTHVHAQLWFRVSYVERYYDVLLSVYPTVHDFRHELIVLSLRWCCIPDLHGYSSRAMMIMTWRFLLLPIMDSEYLSCSLCRWLYWRCFDDDMMTISTTTAEYGLFCRTCQLRRSLLYDTVVMSSSTSLLMSSSSPFRPATSLSSWWWFPVFVRQSSFVLMNLYYATDGSLVSSPYSPLS